MAYKFKGRRFDCGSVPGFVEATNFVYEHFMPGKYTFGIGPVVIID